MIQTGDITALAAKYVNATNRHIFLTGKAGTGKTTFLRSIVRETHKNAVVAAPTGIAAINAEGVTLHSLLQLPFGMFLPEDVSVPDFGIQINTPSSLKRQSKFSAQKRKLLREIDLLIIDEVSMLRADLLDCIDFTLRHIRGSKQVFGGIQILFIGDLMQLPPVVKQEEFGLLQQYYKSPYFFDARCLQMAPPIRVELTQVYRQSDRVFVDLLNRLRHNELIYDDVELLNEHYDPEVSEKELEGYIYLTTHNRKADKINRTKLDMLDGLGRIFEATIFGDFNENAYPAEQYLQLKEGAQVMFIKNDPSGKGQFFNGKIGEVISVHDEVKVAFEDGETVLVEMYEWENIRYTLDKKTNEVDEQVLGTFKQYPLRLAWAVTVHKSQGLTFEKAILDMENTFAAGQLYVALSRLTSLEHLILSTPLPQNAPPIDEQLQEYVEGFEGEHEIRDQLESDRMSYFQQLTRFAFNLDPLLNELVAHKRTFNKDENRSLKQKQLPWTDELINNAFPLKDVGAAFIRQASSILVEKDLHLFAERVAKAHDYFTEHLEPLLADIKNQLRLLKTQTKAKTYRAELSEINDLFINQIRRITKLKLLAEAERTGKPFSKELLHADETFQRLQANAGKDKTPTAEISYNMYKEGKSLKVIAEERGLVESTIEAHLAQYVEAGKLSAEDFVKPTKLKTILKCYQEGLTRSGEIKGALPDSYSWGEIRMGIAHAIANGPSD